jgi:hypothetical protein
MRVLRLLLLLLPFHAGLALAADRPIYEEAFQAPATPETMFGGRLALGAEGPWTGDLVEGAYVLENRADQGAVFYLYIDRVEGHDLSAADAAVDVLVDGENEFSAAGLIYRFDPGDRSYLAFTVADGGYIVWQRTPEGFRHLATGSHPAIKADATNRLAIRASGRRIAFEANGETVFSAAGDYGSGTGHGLFTVGTGRYIFDDFTITRP